MAAGVLKYHRQFDYYDYVSANFQAATVPRERSALVIDRTRLVMLVEGDRKVIEAGWLVANISPAVVGG